MDSKDVIDNVNALMKLGVGDPYRLEHIKQAYILNKIIWKSDNKYLVKHRIDQPGIESEIFVVVNKVKSPPMSTIPTTIPTVIDFFIYILL